MPVFLACPCTAPTASSTSSHPSAPYLPHPPRCPLLLLCKPPFLPARPAMVLPPTGRLPGQPPRQLPSLLPPLLVTAGTTRCPAWADGRPPVGTGIGSLLQGCCSMMISVPPHSCPTRTSLTRQFTQEHLCREMARAAPKGRVALGTQIPWQSAGISLHQLLLCSDVHFVVKQITL